MSQLPKFRNNDKDFQLMQDKWSSILNPILANPMLKGNFLKNINLINGVTVIDHLLSRQMQGWIITDQNAAASIYRSQAFNSTTLTLTSDAAVTVNLVVF